MRRKPRSRVRVRVRKSWIDERDMLEPPFEDACMDPIDAGPTDNKDASNGK
jgi:hypothetical protein